MKIFNIMELGRFRDPALEKLRATIVENYPLKIKELNEKICQDDVSKQKILDLFLKVVGQK